MAWTAANNLKCNPMQIEVFTANIAVSTTPITVKRVVFNSAAAGDRFFLQTNNAEETVLTRGTPTAAIDIAQNINGGSVIQDFGDGFTFPSLYFDANATSQSGLSAGDRVLIYLK